VVCLWGETTASPSWSATPLGRCLGAGGEAVETSVCAAPTPAVSQQSGIGKILARDRK